MTNKSIPLWIHGVTGRMGLEIRQQINKPEQTAFQFAGGSGRVFDGPISEAGKPVTPQSLSNALTRHKGAVITDFSSPEANQILLECLEGGGGRGSCIIVGTTGMSQAQMERWQTLADVNREYRILIAPNTSVGILLLAKSAMQTAGVATQLSFDIEIVETHHRRKKDAPSGTAKFLAESVCRSAPELKPTWNRNTPRMAGEIGMHAVRGGGVYGEHEIRIIGDDEEICLSHRAFSRTLFAAGALTLSRWLAKKPPGFYQLWDVDLSELR